MADHQANTLGDLSGQNIVDGNQVAVENQTKFVLDAVSFRELMKNHKCEDVTPGELNDDDLQCKNDTVHQCDKCGKTFRSAASLRNHNQFAHTAERPHQCEVCGKGFARKYDLDRHLLIHYREKAHRCEVCCKVFATAAQVRAHTKRQHDPNQQYKCEKCGKILKTAFNLKQHELVHSEVKSFRCYICGRGFLRKPDLKVHLMIHKGEKPYACDLCDMAFRKPSTLNKHKWKAHNDENVQNNNQ